MPTTMQTMIERAPRIAIQSGEGEIGAYELHTGRRTVRAIKARLTRERCGGDRWAHAWVERAAQPGVFDRADLDNDRFTDTRALDLED
jgi:hypothetical protein